MKTLKKPFLILISGLMMVSTSYAEVDELNEVLIETEAMTADSEASIIESEELKKELAKEKAEAKRLREQLKQERQRAAINKKRAEKEIATTEKKRTQSQEQIAQLKQQIQKLEIEQKKMQAQVEKVQSEYEVVKAQEEQVTQQRQEDQEDLESMQRDYRKMKNNAKKTATRVSAIRSEVKKSRIEIGKTYRNMKSKSDEYKKMIRIYRRSLVKANRMLDELEMAIEIDQAYDQRLALLGKLPENYRTVSGLNKMRVAQIQSKNCNVRAFPSVKSEVLDTYSMGKKVNLKHHSKSWYTVVHGGEKAFLGKACF